MTQLENLVSELGSESSTSAQRFLDSLSLAVEKARNGELDLSTLARNLDDLNVLLLENGRFPRLDSSLLCRISEEQLSEFTTLAQEFSQQLESENPDRQYLEKNASLIGNMFRLLFPENHNKSTVDFFMQNLHEIALEPEPRQKSSPFKVCFIQALAYYPQGIVEYRNVKQDNRFYGVSAEDGKYESMKNYYINWERSNFALGLPWVSAQEVTISHDIKLVSAFVSSMSYAYWPPPDLKPVDSVSTEMISWAVPHAAEGQMGGVSYYNSWPYPVITPIKNVRQGESLRISVKYPASWRADGVHKPFLSAGKWYVYMLKFPAMYTDYARYYDRSDFVGKAFGIIDVLPSEAAVSEIKIAKVELFDQLGATPAVSVKNNLRRIDPLLPQPGRVQLEMDGQGVNNKKYLLELFLKPEDSNVLSGPIKSWSVNGVDFSHGGTKHFDYSIPEPELLAMVDRNVFVLAKLRETDKKDSAGSEKTSEKAYIRGVFVKNWQKCQDTNPKVEKNTSHFGATPEHPLFPEVVECSFELVDERGKPVISNILTEVYVEEVIEHLVKEWEDPKQIKPEVKIKHRMYGISHNTEELGVISAKHLEHDKPYKVNKTGSFDVRFESYAFFIPKDEKEKYNKPLEGRIEFFVKMYGKDIYFPLYPDELISNPGYVWGELALQNKQMMMYKQWYNVIQQEGPNGVCHIPEWMVAKLEFYIKKMDLHSNIRSVVQYIDLVIGTPLDRVVQKNALKWYLNVAYSPDWLGAMIYYSDIGQGEIFVNPYSLSMRRNEEWEFPKNLRFMHKNAQFKGNHEFYATLLHEFRHVYQHYLGENLKDRDSDHLLPVSELNKLSDIKSFGRFCLFGNIVDDACTYDSATEGYILQTKIEKWSDVGLGFLIDPENQKYTEKDFNLLPNSRFKDGEKDVYLANGAARARSDVYAAIEADARLFEWWFSSDPVEESLPPDAQNPPQTPPIESPPYDDSEPPESIPRPEVSYDGDSSHPSYNASFSVKNFPAGLGFSLRFQGEVYIYSSQSFGIPFTKKYSFCMDKKGQKRYNTHKCVRVWYGWNNGQKSGPKQSVCRLFDGLEADMNPNVWICRE